MCLTAQTTFRPLGCFAPVAVNTGLRPVTRKSGYEVWNHADMTKLFKKKRTL